MRSFQCPKCGHPDWDSAPVYKRLYNALKKAKEATARELSDKLGIENTAVHAKLNHLQRLGFVKGSGKPKVWSINA